MPHALNCICQLCKDEEAMRERARRRREAADAGLLRSRIEDILDPLLFAKDRLVRREIDASTCRTRSDWDRLHAAEDAYHEAREAAVAALAALAKGT